MSVDAGRATQIADLDAPASSKKTDSKEGFVGNVKARLSSLDWPCLIAVAAAAFAGQKLPLDKVVAKVPWAFSAGPVPFRSILIAALFAIVHAFWLSK